MQQRSFNVIFFLLLFVTRTFHINFNSIYITHGIFEEFLCWRKFQWIFFFPLSLFQLLILLKELFKMRELLWNVTTFCPQPSSLCKFLKSFIHCLKAVFISIKIWKSGPSWAPFLRIYQKIPIYHVNLAPKIPIN